MGFIMNNSIRLKLKPDWNKLEGIRNSGENFLKYHGIEENDKNSLIMIISELVENSIKYGNFEDSISEIIINLDIRKNTITIEVNNPINEIKVAHLKRLDKTIQWIRGYQDSFEAYIEKIKIISKKPLEDEESGLGLTRIAYEGKAILDFFVDENILNVSAVSKI
jgi:hypothetical protein